MSVLLIFSMTHMSLAGGLYLNEFGTPSMGNAGAGSAAEASDASTAFHNPAGMTRLERPELMLSAGLGYGEIRFDSDGNAPITGGDGGNAGGWTPLVGSHYVHPINEDLSFGFTVISLSGALLDYDSSWTGRYQNQMVKLLTITAMPSLAYRVNDWLSVGGGPTLGYGNLEMDAAVNRGIFPDGQASLDGDDFDVGYSFSALFELSKQTRLGIVYLSEFEMDLSGDLSFKPTGISVPTDTTIPFAQMIRGGIYHDLNEKWALVGSLGWEDWSVMDKVTISTGSVGVAAPRNWSDTWHYSAGVHYRPVEKWMWRTGFAYDTNPVDATDRTADMPVDQQIRYAIGADYEWSKTLAMGASFVYADLGNGKIRSSTLSGEYDKNNIYLLGMYASWKF